MLRIPLAAFLVLHSLVGDGKDPVLLESEHYRLAAFSDGGRAEFDGVKVPSSSPGR